MSTTPKMPEDFEDRGVLEKLGAGRFDALDDADKLTILRNAAGFAPIPGVSVLDASLAAMEGDAEAARERRLLSKRLGVNLEKMRTPIVKRKFRELGSNWKKAVTIAVGATLGMFAGGALFVMTGLMALVVAGIGGMVGGYVAEKVYDMVAPAPEQDALKLLTEMSKAQQRGEPVPPEFVFAVLAANLPEKQSRLIDNDLERLTGTRRFDVALLEKGESEKVRALAAKYDTVIRADTGMWPDFNNPDTTATEQYAHLINTRQMDVRRLLFRDSTLPREAPLMQPQASGEAMPQAPSTPTKPRTTGLEI